ncbi:DNA replication licensing factor Mcm7 [Caerostris extrusa]|uniref:DNA replication licensing factor Mcm7 n=1 Tax=Caerostris extrusa TaxID=172846 RepID=A0AAV4RN40_CAEEX|nr:DNA replication licensing factor Mcm7 [Caerostris extrusa]
MLVLSTYTCDQCGAETFKTVNSMLFMPLTNCKKLRIIKMNKTDDDELEDHELPHAEADEILNTYNYDMMASSISPEILILELSFIDRFAPRTGILTTLNARVSILAAANPAYGRYNPKRSIEQNIQLHCCHVLICSGSYKINLIRKMIADKLTTLHKSTCIVVNLKPISIPKAHNSPDVTLTSAKNSLGILPLATALTRLNLRQTIVKQDVDEVIRLLGMSKASINQTQQFDGRVQTATGQIIRDMISEINSRTIKMADAQGFQP